MSPLTDDEVKELRIVVGKAVGCDSPYKWGIDDYKADAEYFKAKGMKEMRVKILDHCAVYPEWVHRLLSDWLESEDKR